MQQPEFWHLLVLLAIVLSAGAWRFFRPTGANIFMLLGWGGIVGILMVVYVLRDELNSIPARLTAELGLTSGQGDGQIYPLTPQGHALIDVWLQDTKIPMLLDTGASTVMLQKRDAERLGIFPDPAAFNRRVQTASGEEFMAAVRLPSLRIGHMLLKDTVAYISPKNSGISLLGMTALSQLDITLSGDYVQLKPKY